MPWAVSQGWVTGTGSSYCTERRQAAGDRTGGGSASLPPQSVLFGLRNTRWLEGLQKQPEPSRRQGHAPGEHTAGNGGGSRSKQSSHGWSP